MRKIRLAMIIFLAVAGTAPAQNPTSLEQAKKMSAQKKKPILLEFFQPDCDFCQLASRDLSSNDSILTMLKSVVYLPLDVNTDEGDSLTKSYYVESTFPVFVAADSAGNIIAHWTGYSSPGLFMQSLREALTSRVTIESRYEMLKNNPTLDNILYLAKYNNEIGDNVKAAELFKRAQTLKKGSNYIYDIFKNTADAVWKGKSPFSQLLSAADDVLAAKGGDVTAVSNVGIITARVARKVGKTGNIAKYLQRGIDITNGRQDIKSKDWHDILLADQALYADRDTARAISIRKTNLGPDWESRPPKFYAYAKWCLERKIDLASAEKYAGNAVENATEGKFRASIQVTLAQIYDARGNVAAALQAMQTAIKQDPHNTYYASELERMRAAQNGRK